MTHEKLDYYKNGEILKKPISEGIIETFHSLLTRMMSLQIILFPATYNWYLTKEDREIKKNVEIIRNYFYNIAQQRK